MRAGSVRRGPDSLAKVGPGDARPGARGLRSARYSDVRRASGAEAEPRNAPRRIPREPVRSARSATWAMRGRIRAWCARVATTRQSEPVGSLRLRDSLESLRAHRRAGRRTFRPRGGSAQRTRPSGDRSMGDRTCVRWTPRLRGDDEVQIRSFAMTGRRRGHMRAAGCCLQPPVPNASRMWTLASIAASPLDPPTSTVERLARG